MKKFATLCLAPFFVSGLSLSIVVSCGDSSNSDDNGTVVSNENLPEVLVEDSEEGRIVLRFSGSSNVRTSAGEDDLSVAGSGSGSSQSSGFGLNDGAEATIVPDYDGPITVNFGDQESKFNLKVTCQTAITVPQRGFFADNGEADSTPAFTGFIFSLLELMPVNGEGTATYSITFRTGDSNSIVVDGDEHGQLPLVPGSLCASFNTEFTVVRINEADDTTYSSTWEDLKRLVDSLEYRLLTLLPIPRDNLNRQLYHNTGTAEQSMVTFDDYEPNNPPPEGAELLTDTNCFPIAPWFDPLSADGNGRIRGTIAGQLSNYFDTDVSNSLGTRLVLVANFRNFGERATSMTDGLNPVNSDSDTCATDTSTQIFHIPLSLENAGNEGFTGDDIQE